MQDAAALHADELGCGLDFLHRNRMLWVLSRIRVAIDRMPEIGETIQVLTYPTGTERLFALRQFSEKQVAALRKLAAKYAAKDDAEA